MKEKVFKQYVDKVCSLFNITQDELFQKTKQRHITDARQLLYYVLKNRPMKILYIQKHKANNGYSINHSSVIHGINSVVKKINDDRDYSSIINSIEECVEI